MTDLNKKARWANEAIGPASSVLRHAARGLVDLPTDVTPGARQVAQLTTWRAAQSYAIKPIGEALEELAKLPDWSGGFLVADNVDFDWRTAPFRSYDSFEDFYRKELEPTWGAWDKLQATYRALVAGEIDDQQAEIEVKLSQRIAEAEPLDQHGGDRRQGERPWPPDRVKHLRSLSEDGHTYAEMAKELGVSVPTISRQLRRLRQSKTDDQNQGDNITLKKIIERGTDPTYLAARIKRDHPEIAERIDEYSSIYAAAKAAGLVQRSPLKNLFADWNKARSRNAPFFLRRLVLSRTEIAEMAEIPGILWVVRR